MKSLAPPALFLTLLALASGCGSSADAAGGEPSPAGAPALPLPQPSTHPLKALAIAAGASHTCAIVEGGLVACWGSGSVGQLGDGMAGMSYHRTVPAVVPGIKGATAIAASGDTTCAVTPIGAVCWGDGTYGQLGDGGAGQGYFQALPVSAGLPGVTSIAVGGERTCAVVSGGTVSCWGRNTVEGWLGFTSSDCGPYPVQGQAPVGQPCEKAPRQVPGIASAAVVSAGGDHACVLREDGGVTCWGADSFGQLGDGFSGPSPHDPSPKPVEGVGKALRIATGEAHTCAVTGDERTLSCWGDNGFGQLGLGETGLESYRTVPTLVPGVAPVLDLHAADRATCAVLGDHTVRCWGDTSSLFTTDGTPATSAPAPTPAPGGGVHDALEVRTGGSHACALRKDSTVICWGVDDYGQLGNGRQSLGTPTLTPVIAPP